MSVWYTTVLTCDNSQKRRGDTKGTLVLETILSVRKILFFSEGNVAIIPFD